MRDRPGAIRYSWDDDQQQRSGTKSSLPNGRRRDAALGKPPTSCHNKLRTCRGLRRRSAAEKEAAAAASPRTALSPRRRSAPWLSLGDPPSPVTRPVRAPGEEPVGRSRHRGNRTPKDDRTTRTYARPLPWSSCIPGGPLNRARTRAHPAQPSRGSFYRRHHTEAAATAFPPARCLRHLLFQRHVSFV